MLTVVPRCVCVCGAGGTQDNDSLLYVPSQEVLSTGLAHSAGSWTFVYGNKVHKGLPPPCTGLWGTPSCARDSRGSQVNKAAPALQEPKLEGWWVWEELQGSMVAAGLGR